MKGWGSRGLELEKPQIAIFSLKGPTFAIDAFYKRQPSGVRAGKDGGRIRNAKKFSEPVAVSSAPPTDVSACAYSPSGGAST